MPEIEVGEYIRLDDGTIGRYDINKNWINVVATNTRYIGFDIERDIVKHSKNIIDLIEVGDFVNGVEVVDILKEYRNNETEKSLYMDSDMGTGYRNQMFAEHIKSIVTKEQFEQMKYKVKED